MENALTIDVEDWFCVDNLRSAIKKEDWGKCESRVEKNIEKLLETLKKYDVKATFFVLGWIAETIPLIVKKIEKKDMKLHHMDIHTRQLQR